jgi:phospholipid/cholesterol/gamma-HCH transport system substrate-binding protein
MTDRLAGFSKVLVAVVVVLLIAATVLFLRNGEGKRYLTADFPQTNSVYKGSDVKVLGVPVGKVESLTPRGDVVRVKIAYNGDQKLPTDVKAVVVSPSIVGDRTAVPVELDAIYQSLDDLSVALGPEGANKQGSLSQLVDGAAAQLDGQGAQLNQTLQNFGKLSTTLSNNKEELFGGLREVEQFVSLLKTNDTSVRAFNDSTAQVSTVLEGEREDLAATLKALSKALVDVNGLVKENRGALRSNVDNIASLTKLLAKHKAELEEITVNAPTALSNVALAYNGKSGTLDTRADLPETLFGALDSPSTLLCNLLGETTIKKGTCSELTSLIDGLLPKGLVPDASLPRTAPASGGVVVQPEKVNGSLAEMLAVN